MAKVAIDGVLQEGQPDELLIDLINRTGGSVPHVCYHPQLGPVQTCDTCMLDKNPTASRQELDPQIHAISDETYRKIHALLTDHQKELEKAMQQREQNGGENSRSAPPAK